MTQYNREHLRLTSSTDTTIPVWGFSPVGSTHAKSVPKSLKTDLSSSVSEEQASVMQTLPEESSYIRRDEVDSLPPAKLINLPLLRDRGIGQNDHLTPNQSGVL